MHPAFRKLRLPVIAAPLFIISTPQLVIAQCKAGIVGSMPALNARPPELFDEWLAEITEELAAHDRRHPEAPAAPFAINQIVHRSNNRLERDMEVCARYKVPIVITSLGARPEINSAVHAWGGVVLHDVIDDTFARKAAEKGALILDARSADKFAAGHIAGAVNLPLTDFTAEALAQTIGPNRDRPILIYCNNNFSNRRAPVMLKNAALALNIQTFINLVGYGYANVWELGDVVDFNDPKVGWTAGTPGSRES